MNNILYKMMISNYVLYLKKLTPTDKLNPNCLDAFKISEILSIGLAKDSAKILSDLINAMNELK